MISYGIKNRLARSPGQTVHCRMTVIFVWGTQSAAWRANPALAVTGSHRLSARGCSHTWQRQRHENRCSHWAFSMCAFPLAEWLNDSRSSFSEPLSPARGRSLRRGVFKDVVVNGSYLPVQRFLRFFCVKVWIWIKTASGGKYGGLVSLLFPG